MTDDKTTLERFRIHELIGRYVDALNRRDWVFYKDLWAEEPSLFTIFECRPQEAAGGSEGSFPGDVRLSNLDEIMEMVRRYNDISWLFQLPHGIVVELQTVDRAMARHSLHIVGQYFTMIGICYDRFVKTADGKWRFKHRDFRPSYYEACDPPGFVTRKLPWPMNADRDCPT